jgi:hypothetical protein
LNAPVDPKPPPTVFFYLAKAADGIGVPSE